MPARLRMNPPDSMWLLAPDYSLTNALFREEPLDPRFGLLDGVLGEAAVLVKGDVLLAFVLHVDFDVVLEVLADGGQVGHHRDPEFLEPFRLADPGELQNLRRVQGPRAQNDLLFGEQSLHSVAFNHFNADSSLSFKQNPLHNRIRPIYFQT